MDFRIDLLTNNISISEFDNLILDSEILDFSPINRIRVNDRYVSVSHSAKYSTVFENLDFEIHVKRLTGTLLNISLILEYKKNKFSSAKNFEGFYSKFREFLGKNHLKYSVIQNALSDYFALRLYPMFQKYELSLRRIFILALSPLEDENIIKVVKEKTSSKLDLAQMQTINRIEQLQISELHSYIFELNLNPIENLESHFKNFQSKTDIELRKLIKSSLRVTIWERHFRKFLPNGYDDVLKDNYEQIRAYRNDIMHFHTISHKRYIKISSLMSEAMDELEALEENMFLKWDFDSTRRLVNDISTSELFEGMENLSKTITETLRPTMEQFYRNNTNLNSAIKSMAETLKNIQLPKIEPGVFSALSSVASTMARMTNPNLTIADSEKNHHLDDEDKK
ncbi:TPA: hypothetical protein TUT34_001200 [Streptococcus equi subsp. zooepidemicus]|nr:hypothetical protein [Streptococcus equi subsp. zooepidemicus]HEL0604990.1 hypothetical protein [Streptococcus equi subsp. zooepidemicus]